MLRVKGKGIAKGTTDGGNLLIRLSAILPEKLTSQQKELFEKLSNTGL